MNKKTKLIILLIALIILIILCKIILIPNIVEYSIVSNDKKFNIEEENTYIKISDDKNVYPIRIYRENKKRKIITNIYSYEDEDTSCILPIINDSIVVDMMCYKDNIIYNYSNIVGLNKDLDNYVNSIKEYDINKFKDNLDNKKVIDVTSIYSNNNFNDIIAITTYKGIIVNSNYIEIFKKDVYDNKISAFLNNYYLIADYDNNYEFKYFYIVNLLTKDVSKIKSKNPISLDSYIQGIVDDKIYLYDKDNEKQYSIDIKNKKIQLISTDNSVKYYSNNKWMSISINKANKELYFDYTTLDNIFPEYDEVIETDSYYYLFDKKENNFDLYRVDKNNIKIKKYITNIKTIKIYYKDSYIYFKDNNKIYYYSDETGLRTVLENTELPFNNTIKYYIY